jgi:hypothetical protein
MSLLAASHARTSVTPASAKALRALDRGYGGSSGEPLAFFDPATSLLRTSPLSEAADSQVFSATLPRSGMMRNGTVFPLQALVPLTAVTGYSLLPTCRARESGTWQWNGSRTQKTPTLNGYVKLFPTPTTRDNRGKGRSKFDIQNFPTPTHNGCGNWKFYEKKTGINYGQLNPMWVELLMGFPAGYTDIAEVD